MATRGSLKQCVDFLLSSYTYNKHQYSTLLASENGNYYSVVTEDELLKMTDTGQEGKHRILFRGTLGELKAIARLGQTQRSIFDNDA